MFGMRRLGAVGAFQIALISNALPPGFVGGPQPSPQAPVDSAPAPVTEPLMEPGHPFAFQSYPRATAPAAPSLESSAKPLTAPSSQQQPHVVPGYGLRYDPPKPNMFREHDWKAPP